MGERFQARQTEKAAGALDRVDEAENVVEDLGVVGVLLETHEFYVDYVDAFVRLGKELPQKIVHGLSLCRLSTPTDSCAFSERGQCVVKGFNFGCGTLAGGTIPRHFLLKMTTPA